MKKSKPTWFIYHIRLPGMGLDEGYVGISQQPKERWSSHRRNDSSIVGRAIQKYGSSLEYVILSSFDSLHDALWLEYTLRPQTGIGWNITVGGGMPPDSKGKNNPNYGKKASLDTKKKQSDARLGRFQGNNHPRAVLVDIFDFYSGNKLATQVTTSEYAKDNNLHQGHLTATARGKLKKHKGVYARYTQ